MRVIDLTSNVRKLTMLEGKDVLVKLYPEKESPLEGDTDDLPKLSEEYQSIVMLSGTLKYERNNTWCVTGGGGEVRFLSQDVETISTKNLITTITVQW